MKAAACFVASMAALALVIGANARGRRHEGYDMRGAPMPADKAFALDANA